MIVYILMRHDHYDDSVVEGVYASEQVALGKAMDLNQELEARSQYPMSTYYVIDSEVEE